MAIAFNFGAKNEKSGSSTRKDSTQKTNTQQTQAQTQTAQQTGVTSSLDLETQQFIKDLIGSFDLGGQDGVVQDLTTLLVDRARNSQQAIQDQINPIIADARLQGEQELQALQTQLAQQSGGSLANTLVTSGTSVGRANLESGLAKQRAELSLAGREQATNEISNVLSSTLEAQQKPVDTITNLLNVLKGSNVEQSQQSQSQSDLTSILESLIATKSNTDTTRTKSSQSFNIGYK